MLRYQKAQKEAEAVGMLLLLAVVAIVILLLANFADAGDFGSRLF